MAPTLSAVGVLGALALSVAMIPLLTKFRHAMNG
jgi:hypothetical protein